MPITNFYAQTNKAIARNCSNSLWGDNYQANDWRGIYNYILIGSTNSCYYGNYLRFVWLRCQVFEQILINSPLCHDKIYQ